MKLSNAISLAGGALVLATLAGAFPAASPASASLPGAHLSSASSAVDSVNAKSATAFCPVGQLVVGTGGQINIANTGRAAMVSITPLPGLVGVTAVAAETGLGYSSNWSVKAYAECANPITGLQLVSATSPIDSYQKGLKVSCPSQKMLLGTGATISSPDAGKVIINSIKPMSDLSGVDFAFSESGGGTPNNWYVKGYAICATIGYVPNLQLVSATTPGINSNHAKSAIATCPAGKILVSASASLTTPDPYHVIIDEITPLPNLSGANSVASESTGGTNVNWTTTTYAICATI